MQLIDDCPTYPLKSITDSILHSVFFINSLSEFLDSWRKEKTLKYKDKNKTKK